MPFGRNLVGQQPGLAAGISALGEHPAGLLDIARSVVDKLRVQRIAQVILGAPTMGGDQHACQRIDKRPHSITLVLGAQGITQRRNIGAPAQLGQRLVKLNGAMHRALGGLGIRQAGFTPLARVAQVQLVHQAVETVEVVAHAQGGHAVGMALEELGGFDRAAVADDGLMVLPG